MASLNGFDASQVKAEMGFAPIPNGTYRACVVESEQKANKAGTGSYLKFKIQVIEGDMKGRLLFAMLNLDNPNQDAVRMAMGELSCICNASGVLKPQDTSELHNIPMDILVVVKKNGQSGEMENKISQYKKVGSSPVPAAAASKNPFSPKSSV